MPPKAPPPKAKPKVEPSPPPSAPPKAATGEDGTTFPEFETPTGSAGNSGTSTPRTVPLTQYNELVTRFNQLNETIAKLRDRKEFYKGETVSLSGSLSDNCDALVEANKIIKELEQEANDLAETIGLDKDVILAAARADSDNNGSDMTSRANVPSFSAEDNANARVWFDNLLKYKDSMKWSDEQTNRVGQLALVGKASKWVEYLTLNTLVH